MSDAQTDAELSKLTLAELSVKLRTGALSPVEVVDAYLGRIERLNPRLHAFLTITPDEARAAARQAETRMRSGRYLGPLDGVPIAMKDVIDTAGVLTTAQSRLGLDNVPREDAYVVSKLKQAGGIVVGKTSTWEFAQGGPDWDSPWPLAVNPWSFDHLPGGSSSGSGAAVAARMVPAAVGTDTGGSVRFPAAVCGIVGLRPTYGRVSRRGVVPNTYSMDQCGPLARTVEDCAILLGVMAGYDPEDPASISEPVPDYAAALTGEMTGMRIGLVRHWYADVATKEVEAATDAAAAKLAELGAYVEEVRLDDLHDYIACKTLIGLSELYAVHEGDLRRHPQDFGRVLRTSIIAGALLRAEDYLQALRWRTELASRMFRQFKNYDVLLTAGWMSEAGRNDPRDADQFQRRPPITMPFSLAGNPALSVPCGFTFEGLPLAIQIAGRPFDEARVLRVGDAFERASGLRGITPAAIG